MLWAPVTYVADARQTVWNCSLDAADDQPRYVKLPTGTPPSVLCSCTGMKSVSAPPGICPPNRLANCENPASNRSLLVNGDDQLNCVIFSRSSHTLPDSGASAPKNPAPRLPSAVQSSPRSRHCVAPFAYAEPLHTCW